MKAFLVTAGTVFGLVVIAHVWRIVVEPGVAHEPWFLGLTLLAAGLSAWAWRLVWNAKKDERRG